MSDIAVDSTYFAQEVSIRYRCLVCLRGSAQLLNRPGGAIKQATYSAFWGQTGVPEGAGEVGQQLGGVDGVGVAYCRW